MAEVPGFVKAIVGNVAGTVPFIYQVSGGRGNQYFSWFICTAWGFCRQREYALTGTWIVYHAAIAEDQNRRGRNRRRGDVVRRGHIHLMSLSLVRSEGVGVIVSLGGVL